MNLEREVSIQSQIWSPHVVSCRNVAKTSSNWYILLEYCNGGDLEKYLRLRGKLAEAEARLIIRQVIMGLQALKQKGVLHRDLKLANVMLHFSEFRNDPSDSKKLCEYIKNFEFETKHNTMTCKIADLGFARQVDEGAKAGTSCGTPLYMAPEVMFGKEYSHESDVWSMGCLFYSMLFAAPPFPARSLNELRQALCQGIFKVPADKNLSVAGMNFLQQMLMFD